MNHMLSAEGDGDFVVDLEIGSSSSSCSSSSRTNLEELASTDLQSASVGSINHGSGTLNVVSDNKSDGENTRDNLMDSTRNERCKTMGAKKPPRPPKALSLDAVDQRLIKELAELAMSKRARIRRMKAMRKMKAASSQGASASAANFTAMIFTILFCLVIIFQGVCPGKSYAVRSQGSLESVVTSDTGFILSDRIRNTSTGGASKSEYGSSRSVEGVSGSNNKDDATRAA